MKALFSCWGGIIHPAFILGTWPRLPLGHVYALTHGEFSLPELGTLNHTFQDTSHISGQSVNTRVSGNTELLKHLPLEMVKEFLSLKPPSPVRTAVLSLPQLFQQQKYLPFFFFSKLCLSFFKVDIKPALNLVRYLCPVYPARTIETQVKTEISLTGNKLRAHSTPLSGTGKTGSRKMWTPTKHQEEFGI